MKNITIIVGIIAILLVGGFFAFSNSNGEDVKVNEDAPQNIEGVQEVVLSMKNYNYYPNEIVVEANKPVSISLDSSVRGCYRAFTIKELGVSKYLATPEDSVEFTPSKAGKFKFACSMGMGYGTLVVKD